MAIEYAVGLAGIGIGAAVAWRARQALKRRETSLQLITGWAGSLGAHGADQSDFAPLLRSAVHGTEAVAGTVVLLEDGPIVAYSFATDGRQLFETTPGPTAISALENHQTTSSRSRTGATELAVPILTAPHEGAPEGLGCLTFEFPRPPSPDAIALAEALAGIASAILAKQRTEEFQSTTLVGTVCRISSALEARRPETTGHSERVSRLAVRMAEALDLPASEIEEIALAASLHDLGKVAIPDEILLKSESLSPEELAIVRTYPAVSHQLCAGMGLSPNVQRIVRGHAERLDASGSPDGLRGDELTLPIRIVGLADAFDAMMSPRSYRRRLTVAEALEEVRRTAGGKYDPTLVDLLGQLVADHRVDDLYVSLQLREAA